MAWASEVCHQAVDAGLSRASYNVSRLEHGGLSASGSDNDGVDATEKDNDGLSQGMGYDLALTRPWSFDDITQSTYIFATAF